MRRSGDVVRVTADVIDGDTGFSRWSQTFDRACSDIFAVQSEIADTVARALITRFAAMHAARGGADRRDGRRHDAHVAATTPTCAAARSTT